MTTSSSIPQTAGRLPLALDPAPGRNARLRALLGSGRLLMAPGVFDCLTARLAELANFDMLYMTGSGVSITRLGAPDVALLSFAEILDQAKRIADVTALPLLADADTGYGGPLNVMRTVREMERAGISAVQIEDQDWPKRCGHESGRRVVSMAEMVGRIRAAVDARRDADFLVVARTDARSTEGIDAAIERANRYAEAGADVLFVESPESVEEMARITREVQAPTLSNQVEGGRTPLLPAGQLEALGYRMAIYPNSVTRLFARAGRELFDELRASGSTQAFADQMLNHRGLWDLFEYPAFMATEARYAADVAPMLRAKIERS
jgi:2-methylisocitrate lyase-like PEP mutase family enzyme